MLAIPIVNQTPESMSKAPSVGINTREPNRPESDYFSSVLSAVKTQKVSKQDVGNKFDTEDETIELDEPEASEASAAVMSMAAGIPVAMAGIINFNAVPQSAQETGEEPSSLAIGQVFQNESGYPAEQETAQAVTSSEVEYIADLKATNAQALPMEQAELSDEETQITGAQARQMEINDTQTGRMPHTAQFPEDKVVSILESKMEKDPLSEGEAALETPGSMTEDLMARMPRKTGPTDTISANRINAKLNTIDAASDDECPLENINDRLDSEAISALSNKKPDSSDMSNEDQELKYVNEATAEQGISQQQAINIGPQKVDADQKLGLAAAAQPVENLFDTMVEKIQLSKAGISDKMEIQLKPDNLGKVSIELINANDGLKVKIQADDISVKSLISGQINQLIQSLNDKGIRISNVDIVYTGIAGQGFDQSKTRQEENKQSNTRSYRINSRLNQSEQPFSIWTDNDMADIDSTVSSVEYRA